ncbi:tyrosine-type recombinase/integrase [Streptomyces sp. NPDC087422]|uniref:tyrosine-type recombinase/integrase n=1 Tax=Streptomyces sp. NPDC087422 TaxID=3365786 RepID=UPI0037FAF641
MTKTGRKARPYRLRWVVASRVAGDTFATSALAESRRNELWHAMRRGEAFHIESGLPESEVRAAEAAAAEDAEPDPVLWFEFCREYAEARWRTSAAKTRESLADSLAAVSLAMVRQGEGMPSDKELRLAVRWAMVPAHRDERPPAELKPAYEWLSTSSRPVVDLGDPKVFREVMYRLGYRLDGKAAAGDTMRRRRRALNTALEYAIDAGILTENPLQRTKGKRLGSNDAVDRRVLVNAVQGRQLLAAVSYVGSWHRNRGRRLVAFYAVLLYAALRPAEAAGLRLSDCYLPEAPAYVVSLVKGFRQPEPKWGTLTLRETRPVSGKQWTDSGERHDRRGLKAREAATDRPVPIPPVLVAILRAHLAEFGTAKDGRVFGNERGDVVGSSTYWRVWEDARPYALPPDRVDSPLAGRPYDLRHACITRWLNAGVPIAEVARRVGNSPEVIHRRYHGCIDGHEEVANAKIAKALEEEGEIM